MKYNQIGFSELKVSSVGFGTMSLDLSQAAESMDLVQTAFDSGINYFDTADLYDQGENEILLGKAIESFRKDIVLATKVGNRWRVDGSGWDWDVSKAYIVDAVEQSLKRLKTDYIDLYQIHGGTDQDNFEEVVETLESLVQNGKIRYYGISSIRPNVFTKFYTSSNIISNMMQYSLLDTRPEKYLDAFEQANVSVVARGVLAQGLLVNKPAKSYLEYGELEVAKLQSDIDAFCRENNCNTIAVALQYVLQNKMVASAMLGIRNKEQFRSILEGYKQTEDLKDKLIFCDLKQIHYKNHLI